MPLRGQEEFPQVIDYRIGHYETLQSKVLNEERKILVHLPDDYKTSYKKYPVLFILDAEGIHRYVQAITAIAFYSGARQLPKMIVVGILNTDRARDLTPRKIEQYENSGGGDSFLKFIATELIPYINSRYRSAPYRILFGGSSAGTFTLYTLFNRPEAFNAHIVSRPALNSTADYTWDSEVIFRMAKNLFVSKSSLKKTVYIDCGGEEDALHDPNPIHKLSTIFESEAPRDFRWEIREISESGYRSAVSLKDGLFSIFKGWYYPADSLYTYGFNGIENHVKRLVERFGFPISVADLLAERDMLMFGYRFLEIDNMPEALALFKYAAAAYSNSWNAYDSLAEAYMKNEQVDLAIENYERSLELNPKNENAKEILKQIKRKTLQDAIKRADMEKVETLLDDDSEMVNIKDDRGRTPIFFASMCGHEGIAQFLINNGADVNSKDAYGDPPLYHATLSGHREIVELLVHRGAGINEVMKEGTPLSLAIYRGHLEVAETLIRMGAEVNVTMKNDGTVLHHAAEMADRAFIDLLVKAGAEVNARTTYDVTPLHIAAVYGRREAAEGLIESGAAIDTKSKFAGTPLYQAIAAGHEELVQLLLARGAQDKTGPILDLKGEYFGLKKPGLSPEPFAAGIINAIHRWVRSPSFSPDGKEVYWSAGAPHGIDERIWFMSQEDGQWQPPRIAPFSNKNQDANPHLSADGLKLFFCSNRPLEKNGAFTKDRDIWMVERDGSSWSAPKNMGPPVNTEKPEPYVTVSQNGTLYFHANHYEDSRGGGDIYRSISVNDGYTKPENLGDSVNSRYPDSCPCIAPDETYLVFQSVRPDNHSPGFNLYVSFRKEDGTWTKAINLGKMINGQEASIPKISPDGKYLFFKRGGDIYWVDAKIIDELKPDHFK